MMNIIRNWFTEPDNKTWCLPRALAALSILTLIVAQLYASYHSHTFDPTSFGTGIGAAFAGVGVALGLKKETNQ